MTATAPRPTLAQAAQRRRRRLTVALAVVLAIVLGAGGFVAGRLLLDRREATVRQDSLAPFYVPPTPLPPTPGTLIRSEPMGHPWQTVTGATARRILYATQLPDGTPAASGGMLFIPTSPAPAGGRPIVSWAHPTTGFGDPCVQSRSNSQDLIGGWLQQMLDDGWIVVATDYMGMCTPGTPLYLVGDSEARDVVNAVCAVRQAPNADVGTRWAVWGHSQGDHAALWTGALAQQLAPELTLVAVAAAAPAAELDGLVHLQWDKPVSAGLPVLVVQGTADTVVLPETTALLQQRWCAAGSDLTMDWLGGIGHDKAGEAAGPAAVTFIAAAFDGHPTAGTCEVPPPVAPYAAR